ncbi:MAG: hypothetical protein COS76_01070 [Candidatus Portnoybacteria bacterium CG06_land_8_20_14_3_00_39_12]|uniref:Uncharacterized protein n=2 Tax=Candidatus Portnoyibacteriota TaxID=1817913 RepID=A0A2M7UKC9_9BACT|nr:MAG: hypothetical protein AUJ33_02505 [Parcubacteria group bacterium CG1_02_40_25]PIU75381.1 MAG: hypothetical protein COS76_01070 [Candidatus Portnoybacteria bacterium CG06_land_8_20_14_3_00_39_12]PIZ71683.1 MAG: hypothetical protein COY09_00235 [Candidatus Portnoybacteria bacterium CG_4_10_14_0_2_um_filter_39_11]
MILADKEVPSGKIERWKNNKASYFLAEKELQKFRGCCQEILSGFFVMLSWSEHSIVHRSSQPPPMPDIEYMRNLVRQYEEFRQQKDKLALKRLREQEWLKIQPIT